MVFLRGAVFLFCTFIFASFSFFGWGEKEKELPFVEECDCFCGTKDLEELYPDQYVDSDDPDEWVDWPTALKKLPDTFFPDQKELFSAYKKCLGHKVNRDDGVGAQNIDDILSIMLTLRENFLQSKNVFNNKYGQGPGFLERKECFKKFLEEFDGVHLDGVDSFHSKNSCAHYPSDKFDRYDLFLRNAENAEALAIQYSRSEIREDENTGKHKIVYSYPHWWDLQHYDSIYVERYSHGHNLRISFPNEGVTECFSGENFSTVFEHSPKYMVQNAGKVITFLYNKKIEKCRSYHICLRTLYEQGFLNYYDRNALDTIRCIRDLIDESKKHKNDTYLSSNVFLELGRSYSLALKYSEAVTALSRAIEEDPKNTAAYYERAKAYFELGNHEMALRDFMNSGKDKELTPASSTDTDKIEFGLGFMSGASKGLVVGAKELPWTLWTSLQGLSQTLWVGVKDPIAVPEKLYTATEEVVTYLRTTDRKVLAKELAPEVYDLVVTWDTCTSKRRGEKMGFVMGKYGVDIFAGVGIAKGVKACTTLRELNAACNLKTLQASQMARSEVIELSKRAAVQRAKTFSFEKTKIVLEKQGRHRKMSNYWVEPKLNEAHPSVLTYHDPEALLRKGAGKGCPTRGGEFGQAGYVEVVDFSELVPLGEEGIGYYFDESSRDVADKWALRKATTRGKIHYDKNGGAHIVPAPPAPPKR